MMVYNDIKKRILIKKKKFSDRPTLLKNCSLKPETNNYFFSALHAVFEPTCESCTVHFLENVKENVKKYLTTCLEHTSLHYIIDILTYSDWRGGAIFQCIDLYSKPFILLLSVPFLKNGNIPTSEPILELPYLNKNGFFPSFFTC